MKYLKNIMIFTLIAVSIQPMAFGYDKVALADDISKIKSFNQILSNTDLISLINAKLESDNTSNEDIASMRMIIKNNMLTTPEKENSLLNLFSLEQHAKERFLWGLIVTYFGLPLATILLVALKNGGF